MADNLGALTTDNVPLSALYTEFLDSVERHNEKSRDYIGMFAGAPTKNRTAQIRTRSMAFAKAGSDTTVPDMQHLDRFDIALEDPIRYVAKGAITRASWEKGLASDEVREHHLEALDADYRLITEYFMSKMLTDGGWYDATLTPPSYKKNTFASSHDHYLAYNVSGTPTLAHFNAARHHIAEHGFNSGVVAFINNDQVEKIENLAEWVSPAADMDSPVIQRLQEFGMTPAFKAGGMPVYEEDWVPSGYGLVVSLGVKPLRWRITDNPVTADLIAFEQDANLQYQWTGEYARWCSATVVMPGAGCAIYWGSGTWADPTFDV